MKKNFKYYAVTWAILLALFNILVFLTPNEAAGMTKFGGAFWSGYAFITLAFIGQLICGYAAFRADTREKLFLNLPLITISYAAFVASVVLGSVCMMLPGLPNWVGIILCAVVLALNAVAVVKAQAAATLVSEVGEKVKTQTAFIKTMTVEAASLVARAKSEETKAACKKVYEAFRYSDPMSTPALAETDARIKTAFDSFKTAVLSDADTAGNLADECCKLVTERANKCKLYK